MEVAEIQRQIKISIKNFDGVPKIKTDILLKLVTTLDFATGFMGA
jgi:hypothetical protein